MRYKHLIKRLLLTCALSLLLLNVISPHGFSSIEENKEAYSSTIFFSKVITSDDFVPERLSIDTINNEILNQNETVIVQYSFNNNSLDETCEFDTVFEDKNSYQKKVYCPVPVQDENGIYTFELFVEDRENVEPSRVKLSEKSIFYNSNKSQFPLKFTKVDRGTLVTIAINEEFEGENSKIIHHEIPKEVFELITPQNKDRLIDSQKKFEIVKADPIISWEVGPSDEELEYTLLDASVDENTKSKFNTYESENDTVTQGVIIVILLVLLFIFVPFFLKRKHS
jgi:hypothetical protein